MLLHVWALVYMILVFHVSKNFFLFIHKVLSKRLEWCWSFMFLLQRIVIGSCLLSIYQEINDFAIFNFKLLLKSGQIPRQLGDPLLWEKFMGVKTFSFCKQLLIYNILWGASSGIYVLIKEHPASLFVGHLKGVGVLVRSSQGWWL